MATTQPTTIIPPSNDTPARGYVLACGWCQTVIHHDYHVDGSTGMCRRCSLRFLHDAGMASRLERVELWLRETSRAIALRARWRWHRVTAHLRRLFDYYPRGL